MSTPPPPPLPPPPPPLQSCSSGETPSVDRSTTSLILINARNGCLDTKPTNEDVKEMIEYYMQDDKIQDAWRLTDSERLSSVSSAVTGWITQLTLLEYGERHEPVTVDHLRTHWGAQWGCELVTYLRDRADAVAVPDTDRRGAWARYFEDVAITWSSIQSSLEQAGLQVSALKFCCALFGKWYHWRRRGLMADGRRFPREDQSSDDAPTFPAEYFGVPLTDPSLKPVALEDESTIQRHRPFTGAALAEIPLQVVIASSLPASPYRLIMSLDTAGQEQIADIDTLISTCPHLPSFVQRAGFWYPQGRLPVADIMAEPDEDQVSHAVGGDDGDGQGARWVGRGEKIHSGGWDRVSGTRGPDPSPSTLSQEYNNLRSEASQVLILSSRSRVEAHPTRHRDRRTSFDLQPSCRAQTQTLTDRLQSVEQQIGSLTAAVQSSNHQLADTSRWMGAIREVVVKTRTRELAVGAYFGPDGLPLNDPATIQTVRGSVSQDIRDGNRAIHNADIHTDFLVCRDLPTKVGQFSEALYGLPYRYLPYLLEDQATVQDLASLVPVSPYTLSNKDRSLALTVSQAIYALCRFCTNTSFWGWDKIPQPFSIVDRTVGRSYRSASSGVPALPALAFETVFAKARGVLQRALRRVHEVNDRQHLAYQECLRASPDPQPEGRSVVETPRQITWADMCAIDEGLAPARQQTVVLHEDDRRQLARFCHVLLDRYRNRVGAARATSPPNEFQVASSAWKTALQLNPDLKQLKLQFMQV